MTIELITRPWHTPSGKAAAGQAGLFYDITIYGRQGRCFDYERLLSSTRRVHGHFAHMILDCVGTSVRLTLPAVLGEEPCIRAIEHIVDALPNALDFSIHRRPGSDDIQAVADVWPEYVLGPDSLLSRLAVDTAETAFGA
jgi:hypothetical protein